MAGGGTSGGGQDCFKCVGGALRCHSGKSGKTSLLEIVVCPPAGTDPQTDGDGIRSNDIEPPPESPQTALTVALPIAASSSGEEEEDEDDETTDEQQTAVDDDSKKNKPKGHLGTKMGMDFDKVGGLDEQLNAIV